MVKNEKSFSYDTNMKMETKEISVDKTKFFKDLDDGKIVHGYGRTLCTDMRILITQNYDQAKHYTIETRTSDYGNGVNYNCIAYKSYDAKD
uniref:Uncharacterized protein n=1 Tax=viral metagenome TaxID=1070528 RepID=A0A6C0JTR4_9ZZZZ